MMTMNRDWFSYVLDPHTLLPDLAKYEDDVKLKLMRSFLSQAECHDRRLSSIPCNDDEGQINAEMNSPTTSNNSILITYDKSKTLDSLAAIIAAHFRFNLNLFAGVVTEFPLRLASRLYRMLFLTLLERNSGNDSDRVIGACATPYDMGSWESLEPALAFAVLIYHLWCLQVAMSDGMLSLPNRELTPAVSGLSEVPDQAFLQDSRADRDAILMRHEESVQRLYDLLQRLQMNESAVRLARPLPASFAINAADTNGEETLPSNRILAGVAFTLGRLAFQHNLLEKAADLFSIAQKAITTEKLEYIEEAGVSSLLIDSYLACCSQQLLISSATTAHWHLVDSFCATLSQALDSNDPEFFSLLAPVTITSPLKANLRGSSTLPTSFRDPKKSPGSGKFSQEELISALEVDVARATPTLPQIGFSLRRRLQELTYQALDALTARSAKSQRKEATQLKKVLHEWQSFYTKVVVINGVKWILQSASAQTAAFCDILLGCGKEDRAYLDAKEAASLLFAKLNRYPRDGGTATPETTEVVNFVKDFLVKIQLNLSSKRAGAFARPMLFVNALSGSPLISYLPEDVQSIVNDLQQTGGKLKIQTGDNLLYDLPSVSTVGDLPGPLVDLRPVRGGHFYSEKTRVIPPFSLLVTSSIPKVVATACTDLLNAGFSVEVILRSGGWLDSILPTVLKWVTPSDLPPKIRREGTLSATFPPPPLYEFVAVASENNQYLPPLVLLLRAIEFRRERDDLEAAVVFRLAVNSHILPQGTQQQQQQGSPTNGGPLWRRSLLRWIRGVVEHEMVVEDLNAINGRECPSSSIEQTDEMELMSRCKAILTSTDIGPEAVISDDLLTSAACYVLCKEPTFLSTLGGGSSLVGLINRLHKFSFEQEGSLQSLCDICTNHLPLWFRPTTDVNPNSHTAQTPTSTVSSRHPATRLSRDPRHPTAFSLGDGNGGSAGSSNTPMSVSSNTGPLKFLIKLLWKLPGNDGLRILDNLITCLAACLVATQPLFKTNAVSDTWLSSSSLLSGVQPQTVSELLQFAVTKGLLSSPKNVKLLLLQADIQMSSSNPDPRTVLSLILQAASVASDYFSRPVPPNIFTERVVLGMIQSCRSLGYIGEAIVLSQFLPSEATAFQLIEELRCSSDPASGAFDCLDGVAGTYLWNLNVLQGLTNLYQLKKSFSKRSTFLRSINQPEVNVSNTKEVLLMTKNKRAAEFLRHLCDQILV